MLINISCIKKSLLLIFFALLGYNLKAQYILNPSFENYSSCPIGAGQVSRCSNWSDGLLSPDYFNCAFSSYVTPIATFSSSPSSGTGSMAMGGSLNYGGTQGLNFSESIITALQQGLVGGNTYCICFDIKQDASSDTASNPGGNSNLTDCFDFGGYFYNNSSPLTTFPFPNNYYNVTPSFKVNLLSLTNGYQRYCFSYTAIGGENALVFGFFQNANSINPPCDTGHKFTYVNVDSLSMDLCFQNSKADTVCLGDSVLISTQAFGSPLRWYEISSPGNIIGSNDSIWVSPISSTSYVVQDSLFSDTLRVEVINSFADAGVTKTVCLGDSVSIGGSPS